MVRGSSGAGDTRSVTVASSASFTADQARAIAGGPALPCPALP